MPFDKENDMRVISLTLTLCVIALGVVGCGKSAPPPAANEQSETLKAMQAQLGMPIYPGADLDGDLATGTNDLGGEVMMVSFVTEDGLDEVAAFYRKNLTGYKARAEKKIGQSRVAGFTRAAGKESSLIVIEQPAQGPTKIAVTVTKAAVK